MVLFLSIAVRIVRSSLRGDMILARVWKGSAFRRCVRQYQWEGLLGISEVFLPFQ